MPRSSPPVRKLARSYAQAREHPRDTSKHATSPSTGVLGNREEASRIRTDDMSAMGSGIVVLERVCGEISEENLNWVVLVVRRIRLAPEGCK